MAYATQYQYNDTVFRAQFPAFSDPTTFPEALLQMYWDQATTIIANTTYGFVAAQGGPMALNLLTAHLAALSVQIANGENPAILTGAGIDKISVNLQPPPNKTLFQYWLGTTPYGQQLLALLSIAAVGGFSVPGGPGRAGFQFNGLPGNAGAGFGFR